jgi:hypothetical protein
MASGFVAIAEWWHDWADVFQVIGFPLALAALGMAWWQLRHAARTASSQFLLAIEETLTRPEIQDMRGKIFWASPPWTVPDSARDRTEVRQYIAVFDALGRLVGDRQVSIEQVDDRYGNRIAAITNNASVRGHSSAVRTRGATFCTCGSASRSGAARQAARL